MSTEKMKVHTYNPTIRWTGNRGEGTTGYADYDRSHLLLIDGKMDIPCSSDPAFRGDNSKHNPEDLFVASISSCHMLWYLHLCADAGVIVTAYTDRPVGKLQEGGDQPGFISELTLNPTVTVKHPDMAEKARELHHIAGEKCFLANSLNFKVKYSPVIEIA